MPNLKKDFYNGDDEKLLSVSNNFDSNKKDLESIINSNKINVPILIDLAEKMYTGFELQRKYSKFDETALPLIPETLSKISKLEELFSNALAHTIQLSENSLEYNFSELTKLAGAELWKEVNNKRKLIDDIANQYDSLEKEVIKKPLFWYFKSRLLTDYINKLEGRQDLLEKLSFIEQKYSTIEWNEKSIGLLKAFISGKKGFFGFLRQSPLGNTSIDEVISGFEDITYYEGVFKAKALKEEISYTADNFSSIMQTKRYMEHVISRSDKIQKEIGSLFGQLNRQFPVTDKVSMKKLSDYHAEFGQPYKATEFSMLSNLQESFIQSRAMSSKAIESGFNLLLSNYGNRFDAIKTNDELTNEDTLFLNNYETFLSCMPVFAGNNDKNRLSEISGLRKKVVSHKYDSRLRQIESIACQPASYSDVDAHIRLLNGARGDLEHLVNDEKNPFLSRAGILKAGIESQIDLLNEEKKSKEVSQHKAREENPGYREPERHLGAEKEDREIEVYTPRVRKGEKAFIRGEGDFFEMATYLSYIGFNTTYYWFGEIMNNTSIGVEDRLSEINERFSKGNAINEKDYDYVSHLFYALTENINRGNLNARYSKNTQFRKPANETVSSINAYLERSQVYLGFSPKKIEEHAAVTGAKNYYNRELCAEM